MKPTFSELKRFHYSSDRSNKNFLDGSSVYGEIGHDIKKLMKQNPAYENTCAVRMSIALIKAGVSINGRLPINTGAYKGRKIETGAKLLADELMRTIGKPLVFKPADAATKINGRKGIIFFNKIPGYGGGHIDLVEPVNGMYLCNSSCFFYAEEVWFWELK
jgi:hypothetical protein